MSKARTPEQEQETREALFLVSARAFLRDGYEATSMKMLAAEAGCTTGKFYSNFSGKQEILSELLSVLFEKNYEEAVKLSAKKDSFFGALAFLDMILQGGALYENLLGIYREGLALHETRAVAEAYLAKLLGASEDAREAKLRIRVAVGTIPDYLKQCSEWEYEALEKLYLTMLGTMLGRSEEEAAMYAELLIKDARPVREKAYDGIVKLLQGRKKKSVKKM